MGDILISQANTTGKAGEKPQQASFRNRIIDLIEKLDGKYSGEAARKLICAGRDAKTKQQIITILQEKSKEFEKEKKFSESCDVSLVSSPSCFPAYIRAVNYVLSEIKK